MKLFEQILDSRLILGTSKYPSLGCLVEAIKLSSTQCVTVSLRRESGVQPGAGLEFIKAIRATGVKLLPNTAGCFLAKEAILTAQMAREMLGTHWIKLEVIGSDYHLNPHPFELLTAATELVKQGFEVFPYTTEDLALGEKLIEAGCKILMPLAAPIGTARGISNPHALQTYRREFKDFTLIVDAGLGAPSHAAQVMEMGFDGVMVNSAVALAQNPREMAHAFSLAIEGGRKAFQAGLMDKRDNPVASTPTLGRPFWHQTDETSHSQREKLH